MVSRKKTYVDVVAFGILSIAPILVNSLELITIHFSTLEVGCHIYYVHDWYFYKAMGTKWSQTVLGNRDVDIPDDVRTHYCQLLLIRLPVKLLD